MDKVLAVKLLTPLVLAYPAAKITNDTVKVYATALSELTELELKAGVMKCMRTCKFFPSIAEIMEAAQQMVEVATGTACKDGDEAWNEVQRQMQEAFVYKKPVFSTPEIEKAALSMGWIGLCETPTDNIATVRAQFLKMYEAVCQRKKETRINTKVLQTMGPSVKTLVGSIAEQIGKEAV
jgi:hypothetical protein